MVRATDTTYANSFFFFCLKNIGLFAGCDFALRSCLDWMLERKKVGQSIHPFCDKVKRDPLETECTDDRSSVALCNLVQHVNELPVNFQVTL